MLRDPFRPGLQYTPFGLRSADRYIADKVTCGRKHSLRVECGNRQLSGCSTPTTPSHEDDFGAVRPFTPPRGPI
jgi:hypothetical protein